MSIMGQCDEKHLFRKLWYLLPIINRSIIINAPEQPGLGQELNDEVVKEYLAYVIK